MLLVAVVVTAINAVATDNRYLDSNTMPDPTLYMPGPPDTMQIITNGDFARWIWGKTMRSTERGERASLDSKYGIIRMCDIYSDVLGLEITPTGTPAIYNLMLRAGETGAGGVSAMKRKYFRKRPFLLMNEKTWGKYDSSEELAINSSYPSSHTGCGWGTALALAEMAPHLQDTILRLGVDYGISRVITGAHWQSDVNAAMLCASAAIASAHATSDFHNDMAAARMEYMQLKGLTESEIGAGAPPSALMILDPPIQADSFPFVGEVIPYWQAKAERASERGNQAIADTSLDDDDIIAGFAASTGVDISSATMPNVVALLKATKRAMSTQAIEMKGLWHRNRPFVQLGDPALVPSLEEQCSDESSYPSQHAVVGWGLALVLSEVMPECQNSILMRGREYGRSRVIAGFNYPGDVQAGQVMAACLLTHLRSDSKFNNMLGAAKLEFETMKARHDVLPTARAARVSSLQPLPTDSASAAFASDIYHWIWGKTMRGTEQGEMARLDSQCGIDRLVEIYGDLLGIDINESHSPSIYNMIMLAAQAGTMSIQGINENYKRPRPFMLMNEQPWGANDGELQHRGSTVSPLAHPAMVWSTALAMASMAPHLHDTIMVRALACAGSGVITGACWKSDVDVAILCANDALAKLEATADFAAVMSLAQEEYLQLTGLSHDDLRTDFTTIDKILGPPHTAESYLFAGDIVDYWMSMPLRDTERGALAWADAALTDDYVINMIDQCCPRVLISETKTPHIAILIKVVKLILTSYASSLKESYQRIRPFRQFAENVPYGGEAMLHYGKTSYPSRHAIIGWGLARVMAHVMPESHDALIERGYTYGQSRVITGLSYETDAQAGRLMAECALVKIFNESLFKTLIDGAIEEYQHMKSIGDVNGDGSVNSVDITALYNYLLNDDASSIINGDQDGDGRITAVDVTVVYNILLGI